MQKFKKVLVLLLVVVFLAGAATPAAVAGPPQFAKSVFKIKGKKALKLTDVKGHWAEAIMVEMNSKGFIKGYEDATFKPSNVVSKLETVIMLVRVLGLEEEAEDAVLTTGFKHGKEIPSWAAGYVQVAYERGILTEEDLNSFRPNQGAKRAEVAAMLVRALGLNQSLQEQNWFSLRFEDAQEVPEELRSFILAIVQNGIMQGSTGNKFQPNKPITRAEMAILLDRIDGKIEDIELPEVNGIIRTFDDDSISVKIGSHTQNFILDEDVTIYLDGKYADLDDLEAGYRVKLLIGEDGQVIFIKALSTELDATYQGKITQLALGINSQITIKDGSKEYQFKVDGSTEIEIDGDEAFLSELAIGQEVTVKAKGDLALAIIVEDEEEKEYEGEIIRITLGNSPALKIEDKEGDEYTFLITDNTRIYLDGDRTDFDELAVGYRVELVAQGNEVLRIEAESDQQREYEGEIIALTLGTNPGVAVETDDDKVYTFKVNSSTRIYLEDARVELSELRVGYEVEVVAEDGVALRIEAED